MLGEPYLWLLQNPTALETDKPDRWRDIGTHLECRIQEVQHLHPQNRMESADEDEHLSRRHDAFLNAVPGLLRRLQPQYFVRCNERPFNVVHRSINVPHDRREALTAEVVCGFLHGGGAAHVADQLSGLILIRRKGDA